MALPDVMLYGWGGPLHVLEEYLARRWGTCLVCHHRPCTCKLRGLRDRIHA